MTTPNTDPIFASEAQEVFSPEDRVYLAEKSENSATPLAEGTEGTYRGHIRERLAVVDWDTPSGEPFRVSVPFAEIRQLYR